MPPAAGTLPLVSGRACGYGFCPSPSVTVTVVCFSRTEQGCLGQRPGAGCPRSPDSDLPGVGPLQGHWELSGGFSLSVPCPLSPDSNPQWWSPAGSLEGLWWVEPGLGILSAGFPLWLVSVSWVCLKAGITSRLSCDFLWGQICVLYLLSLGMGLWP